MGLSLAPIGRRECCYRLGMAGAALAGCVMQIPIATIFQLTSLGWKAASLACLHMIANALARRSHHLRIHSVVWSFPILLMPGMIWRLPSQFFWPLTIFTAFIAICLIGVLLIAKPSGELRRNNALVL